MKIAVSGYIGKKITGIGRNLICLLDHSQNKEIQYVVYTNADMKEELKFSNPRVTVKTYAVSKNSSMGNLLWTTFVFPFMVLKERADRALIPNFTLLLLKFKPTVVILHDLIEFHVPDKFSKKKMFYRTRLADPITARRADAILTVSQNSKKDMVEFLHVPEKKIKVIYNGVDRAVFRPMEPARREKIFNGRGWPRKFLLYAGTIDHPGKNVMGVVRAFEKLRKEEKYHEKLVLAGMPGSGYEVVADAVRRSQYRDQIVLTGFVSDEELTALYSQCDVFCFISLYEGFGIPPLEAMACGAKTVVSSTSSLPEVVGDVGWKADPNSIDDIARNLVLALKEPVTAELHACAERHLQNFSWNRLSVQFENAVQW